MQMNPYEPPQTSLQTADLPRGKACRACGSRQTHRTGFSRPKINILTFLLFGWMYLLLRNACSVTTFVCGHCGASYRYKTAGSWIALFALVILTLLVILGLLSPVEE